MNRSFSTLLFAVASSAVMLFSSCDNIDENDRYIEMPLTEVKRTVLLEDFTGQNCKNCPNAHETIHALQEGANGDAIIAVSIHPAGNGLVYDEETFGAAGLGTEDGKIIAAAAKAGNQLPIGQVNRRTGLLDYSSWSAAISRELERETIINVEGAASIADSTISVSLTVLPREDFRGTLNVWVLEDSVIARQLLPNGKRDNNYVHNHLLRKAVTPAMGQEVGYSHSVYHNETLTQAVKEYWSINHLRVIAFFANQDGTVEQAINIVPEIK